MPTRPPNGFLHHLPRTLKKNHGNEDAYKVLRTLLQLLWFMVINTEQDPSIGFGLD